MRVMAMIMIVAFHSLLLYTGTWWQFEIIQYQPWIKCARFLDSIDLSMFVFLSGFLYGYFWIYKGKYHDRRDFLRKKVLRLLVPYMFWGIFMILMQPSIHSWDLLLVGISHLWFLMMLFGLFCLASFLMYFNLEKISGYLLVGFFLLLYCLWLLYYQYSPHHFFLCIEKVFSYSIPFFIGFFVAKYRLWELAWVKGKVIFLTFLSLFILFVYVFFIPQLNAIADDLLIRIFSYSFIVGLFVLLQRNISHVGRIILKLDKLSMGIYIFNQIIINYMVLDSTVLNWLNTNYMIGPVVIFVVSFFVPLFLSSLFIRTKFLSWTIG